MDWYLDRLAAKAQASLPKIDWRSLLDGIGEEIQGSSVFLEKRDERFVPVNGNSQTEGLDVVSLIITWSHEGIQPWDSKEPAKKLMGALADRQDLNADLLLSRSLESFVGYYVRIRPNPSLTTR